MEGLDGARGFGPGFGMPGEASSGPSPFAHPRAAFGARSTPPGQFGEPGGLDDFEGMPEEMQDPMPDPTQEAPGDATNGETFGGRA